MAIKGPGYVFIHIPKCGGTLVQKLLKEHCSGERVSADTSHWSPAEVEAEGQFSFCFIRQPVAWLQSYFYFHKEWLKKPSNARGWRGFMRERAARYGRNIDWDKYNNRLLPVVERARSFDGFARRVEAHSPGIVGRIFQEFAGPCNFIGRLESLADDLLKVADWLQLDLTAELIQAEGLVNKSPRPAAESIEPETLRLIRENEGLALRIWKGAK